MLIHELRMAVPAQQHTKVVKPGDHALKLDAIDQEYGEVGLVLPNMVQERVLKVMSLLIHG